MSLIERARAEEASYKATTAPVLLDLSK